jgi:hypothetical protein
MQNNLRFPWVKLIVALIVEWALAYAVAIMRGEYFGETGGLAFFFVALLTISITAFLHARKSAIKVWYGVSVLFVILALAYALNFYINFSRASEAQNPNDSRNNPSSFPIPTVQ